DQQYIGKGIFTGEKVAESKNDKKFQEAANTLRETTAEGKSVEQSGQKKTTEASVQTDTQPSKHDSQTVSPSVSKSSVKEKLNNKKPEQDKKDNMPQPQENQKEEGFLSLLKRFVKKMLEKLLGEDEKSVENARGMKENAQRDTSNNEEQQKSKHFDKILNQDQSVSEGLKQATKLENPTITSIKVNNEVNTGRER
ncbi:MAG: hypothetical protein ACEY3K_00105, partial [Wolbachia sp.]